MTPTTYKLLMGWGIAFVFTVWAVGVVKGMT